MIHFLGLAAKRGRRLKGLPGFYFDRGSGVVLKTSTNTFTGFDRTGKLNNDKGGNQIRWRISGRSV